MNKIQQAQPQNIRYLPIIKYTATLMSSITLLVYLQHLMFFHIHFHK